MWVMDEPLDLIEERKKLKGKGLSEENNRGNYNELKDAAK